MTLKIKVDHSKCNGCRHCEAACAIYHVEDGVNPHRSRIRIIKQGDEFFPVLAGPYTDAKCNVTNVIRIGDKEYDMCALCVASCPIKPVFREPDTEIPLKCDHCGEPVTNALCVKWCTSGALTLVETDD